MIMRNTLLVIVMALSAIGIAYGREGTFTYQVKVCEMRELPFECRKDFQVWDNNTFQTADEPKYAHEKTRAVFADLNSDGYLDIVMEKGAGFHGTAGDSWEIYLGGPGKKYRKCKGLQTDFMAMLWYLIPDKDGNLMIVNSFRSGWQTGYIEVHRIIDDKLTLIAGAVLMANDVDDWNLFRRQLNNQMSFTARALPNGIAETRVQFKEYASYLPCSPFAFGFDEMGREDPPKNEPPTEIVSRKWRGSARKMPEELKLRLEHLEFNSEILQFLDWPDKNAYLHGEIEIWEIDLTGNRKKDIVLGLTDKKGQRGYAVWNARSDGTYSFFHYLRTDEMTLLPMRGGKCRLVCNEHLKDGSCAIDYCALVKGKNESWDLGEGEGIRIKLMEPYNVYLLNYLFQVKLLEKGVPRRAQTVTILGPMPSAWPVILRQSRAANKE